MTGQLLQMSEFEKETGVTLPAIVCLKGTDLVLPLHRVVTFTGTRFLRTVSPPTRSNGETSASEGLSFPEDELEIAKAFFSMMVDNPPESVTVEQLRDVLRMCQFCMADTLLDGFPAYLEGAVRSCASDEVCSLFSYVRLFSVVSVRYDWLRPLRLHLCLCASSECYSVPQGLQCRVEPCVTAHGVRRWYRQC